MRQMQVGDKPPETDYKKEVGDKPAGNPTTSTQPDTTSDRPGRQMNRIVERKWETSRPGTRPDHPAPRQPFFKALRTPNRKLFGEKHKGHKNQPATIQ